MSEIADYQKMNEIRDRVASTVSDPETAEALKPWYGQWVQTSDLQRRIPADLQPAHREAGGHQGQGR